MLETLKNSKVLKVFMGMEKFLLWNFFLFFVLNVLESPISHYYYTNVGHYAVCNREKMKIL